MTILEQIIAYKRSEVIETEEKIPLDILIKQPLYNRSTYSLKDNVLKGSGIIAEFKRKSPSKGNINTISKVVDVVTNYEKCGVSGVSVLTDSYFFGGSNEDMFQARKAIQIPILRKDFIISPYQIHQAKAIGADAILLIASVLTKKEIKQFTILAHQLKLEVLLEIHKEDELEKFSENVDLVGINNRNLKTFKVDFKNAIDLSKKLPKQIVKIAESGIKSPKDIQTLKQKGFQGFLIGETFMKTKNPGKTCCDFLKKI